VTNDRFADVVPVDPAVTARRRVVALAGHEADPTAARHGLDDEAPIVRATAVTALERLGGLDDGLLAALLRDPSAVVRRRAAEVAATHPRVSLLASLDDADDAVVEVAAWSCGEQHESSESVPPDLLGRLSALATGHDDALVREAAVASLGSIGDPLGLPAILVATHDKANVRRRAVIALAPFDGPEVDDALERARHDRDWQVRQAAEDLLD
jgi:HEAT repeat protein